MVVLIYDDGFFFLLFLIIFNGKWRWVLRCGTLKKQKRSSFETFPLQKLQPSENRNARAGKGKTSFFGGRKEGAVREVGGSVYGMEINFRFLRRTR